MAPEQVAGDPVDARCDIYALGCVLYELVTGQRPFEGSPVVVMGKQLRDTAERPRVRMPALGIPAEVEAVIMRALAKEKTERFATALEMREALQEALVAPDRRRVRGKRISAFMVGASLVLCGAAVFHDHTSALRDRLFSKKDVATVTVPVESLPAAPPPTAVEPEPVAATTLAAADIAPAPAPPPVPVSAPAPAAAQTSGEPAAIELNKPAPNPMLVRASASHAEPMPLADARTAAREHPSDPRALRALAHAALRAGELREARRAAESWAVHDTGAEPRLFLAQTLEASGRRREARAVLDEWLSNHPDSAEAKRMRDHLGSTPEPAIKRTHSSR